MADASPETDSMRITPHGLVDNTSACASASSAAVSDADRTTTCGWPPVPLFTWFRWFSRSPRMGRKSGSLRWSRSTLKQQISLSSQSGIMSRAFQNMIRSPNSSPTTRLNDSLQFPARMLSLDANWAERTDRLVASLFTNALSTDISLSTVSRSRGTPYRRSAFFSGETTVSRLEAARASAGKVLPP